MFKKIFGAIFGTPDTMQKVVHGAVDGIDKLFYTDEEKAETKTARLEWLLRWMQATQPQNVARRFIAIAVTLLWAFLVVYAVLAFTIQYVVYSVTLTTAELAKVTIEQYVVAAFTFDMLTKVVAVPFAGIMAFYFAAHVIGRYQQGKANE